MKRRLIYIINKEQQENFDPTNEQNFKYIRVEEERAHGFFVGIHNPFWGEKEFENTHNITDIFLTIEVPQNKLTAFKISYGAYLMSLENPYDRCWTKEQFINRPYDPEEEMRILKSKMTKKERMEAFGKDKFSKAPSELLNKLYEITQTRQTKEGLLAILGQHQKELSVMDAKEQNLLQEFVKAYTKINGHEHEIYESLLALLDEYSIPDWDFS